MSRTAWDRIVCDALREVPGAELLSGLVRGEHAVVVLKNLLSADLFELNRKRVLDIFDQAHTTAYTNGALTTIGPYLAKYLDRPQDYFADAAAARQLLNGIGFDLDVQVRAALAGALGLTAVEPAREPDGRAYADSVIRIHADGVHNPLHNDNIMRDAAGTGLALAGLDHQLSCIVCLQECDSGGELVIYGRTWQPGDERFKTPGSLGYPDEVVTGAPVHVFTPQVGDVYLINPTNYHAIRRVSGSTRLTMGFFMGLTGDCPTSIVVWG
jgi:hypothetical protein